MITEPITPELLTIQQVADRVGLTRQALYPRLDRDLSEFYVEIDGRKMLKSTVVEYILSKPVNKVDSKIDDKIDERLLDALQDQIDTLKAQNEQLYMQLTVKDMQIAEKDLQISGIVERLHETNVLNLNLSERGQQLLQAAIDEAADAPKPPPDVPTPPVKQKWYQRLLPRRKPTK